MDNPVNTPHQIGYYKCKHFQSQEKAFFEYLKDKISTASMIAAATGIPQKNITRFKRKLEKKGRLWQVNKKACKQTGFKAWYITTNQDLAKFRSLQTDLFNNEYQTKYKDNGEARFIK